MEAFFIMKDIVKKSEQAREEKGASFGLVNAGTLVAQYVGRCSDLVYLTFELV